MVCANRFPTGSCLRSTVSSLALLFFLPIKLSRRIDDRSVSRARGKGGGGDFERCKLTGAETDQTHKLFTSQLRRGRKLVPAITRARRNNNDIRNIYNMRNYEILLNVRSELARVHYDQPVSNCGSGERSRRVLSSKLALKTTSLRFLVHNL